MVIPFVIPIIWAESITLASQAQLNAQNVPHCSFLSSCSIPAYLQWVSSISRWQGEVPSQWLHQQHPVWYVPPPHLLKPQLLYSG